MGAAGSGEVLGSTGRTQRALDPLCPEQGVTRRPWLGFGVRGG